MLIILVFFSNLHSKLAQIAKVIRQHDDLVLDVPLGKAYLLLKSCLVLKFFKSAP